MSWCRVLFWDKQDKSHVARNRKLLFTNSSSLVCYLAYIKRVTGIQNLQNLVRNM